MWLKTVFLVVFTVYVIRTTMKSTYDTIIVGLGASGCAAASVLCKAGKKVLALEAQDRIGGRVHTVPFGTGVVELGAEWIHGIVKNPVYELAVKNNIITLEQDHNHVAYRSDGSTYDGELIGELIEVAAKKVKEKLMIPESTGQYLTKELMQYIRVNRSELLNDQDFITEFLNFMDPLVSSNDAANSWNDISTHGKCIELEGCQETSWHKYGYETLFKILLNTYNNGKGFPNFEKKLNKVVSKISYPSDPKADVEVTCEDGSTYRARNVIVTVSLGVLKETHNTLFSPPLPKNKVESIDYISMGTLGKIILDFDQVWWVPETYNNFFWREEDKKLLSNEDIWLTKIIGAYMIMGSSSSISLWVIGNESILMETLPHDVVLRKSMEVLRKFMGKNIPEPVGMLKTSWHSNPYTRGTYSFDNLKSPLYPQVRSVLAEPLTDNSGAPRVLFAGEATHTVYYATVHGAVLTGYREAKRLLYNTTTLRGQRE